ncbi:PIN domain-containing protein [Asticcacaulis solisilvae]|uniref:PIN domain-containing protein n=1 Tax=Asticcacaulis solisilvae TaxID=1217274 RepID=UPI003FD786C3
MIGLDTNVIIRYVMQDDAKQAAAATNLIESLTSDDPGFITIISIVESVWVLSSSYELTREQIALFLEKLLSTQGLRIDRAEDIWRALRVYQSSRADFADCLIERTAFSAGCSQTVTFDIRASKAAGMVLLS